MPFITPSTNSPKEETLAFLRAFARLYTPPADNENSYGRPCGNDIPVIATGKC